MNNGQSSTKHEFKPLQMENCPLYCMLKLVGLNNTQPY